MSNSPWWQNIRGDVLAPLEGFPGVFVRNTSNQIHSFATLAAELDDGRIVATTSRDTFSMELGIAIVSQARSCLSAVNSNELLNLHSPFGCRGYSFDIIVVLGPACHRIFSTSPAIHHRTFEAIPAYRCEFFPSDSVAIVNEVRKSCLSTVDWSRAASPRIWAQYFDADLNMQTRQRRPGLINSLALIELAKTVLGNAGSWLKVVNWRSEKCTCTFFQDEVLLEQDAFEQTSCPNGEFLRWLSGFVACHR